MTESPSAPVTADTPGLTHTPAAQPARQGDPGTPPSEDNTDWKAEAAALKAESRKWEQRSKENHAAAKDAERQRLAAMTESERALSEAESKGRTAAAQEYGKRLARSEFDSAAARRNPDVDTSAVLEFVDLSRFVGDDGEPNAKAIKDAVERLVPAPVNGLPQFDGGARSTPAPSQGMNDFIRQAAGRA